MQRDYQYLRREACSRCGGGNGWHNPDCPHRSDSFISGYAVVIAFCIAMAMVVWMMRGGQ